MEAAIMKGISTIIAVIMLLMITVVLLTLFWSFSNGLFGSVSGGVAKQTNASIVRAGSEFAIINAVETGATTASVTVRNSGTQSLDLDTIAAFVDDNAMCGGLYGDLNENNGVVDAGDLLLISRYLAGSITLTDCQKIKADVDSDGSITATDKDYMNNYAAGISPYGRTGQALTMASGSLVPGSTSTFTVTAASTASAFTCDESVLRISVSYARDEYATIICS